MQETVRRRTLWLTVPLYAVVLAILAFDVWTTIFWIRVGGSLGWAVAAIESGVALVLGAVLTIDARRQWLLRNPTDGAVTS